MVTAMHRRMMVLSEMVLAGAPPEATRERGKLRTVVLVHGEPGAQRSLREALEERSFPNVVIARRGAPIRL